MTDRTPKELLKEFFHFSYHVYSMDEMTEKLEQLQEKLPVKNEFGWFDDQHVELNDAIKKLKQASKNIHDVMELAFDKDVKAYMDECNNK
tara:strand:+ start:1630 stop:1899 length:270 start_codon:yes stop_codon:yes gene_type:complete